MVNFIIQFCVSQCICLRLNKKMFFLLIYFVIFLLLLQNDTLNELDAYDWKLFNIIFF